MIRSVPMVLVAILLLSVVSAGSIAVAQAPSDTDVVLPGERLSGTIEAENAEYAGELTERSFSIQLASAETNETKAAIVADRIGSVESQLETLEERKAELEAARDAGEISEGRYRAELARLAAERSNAERVVNRSARTAEQLPPGLREDHDLRPDHVEQLRERARGLGGPEMDDAAREIAGPDVGERPSTGPPADRGQPGTPGPGDAPGQNDDDDEDGDDDDDRGNGPPPSAGPPG